MRIVIVIIVMNLISCTPVSERKPHSAPIPIMPELLDEDILSSFNQVHLLPQVFTLDEQQQQNFLEFFNSNENKKTAPNLRVYKFLENKLTNFNNYEDTLIASDVLSRGSGNCLSLAILTKSLTMLANIPILYEIVETEPIYQRSGDVLLVSKHIRTTLLHKTGTVRGKPRTSLKDISIDYYPTDGNYHLIPIKEVEFYSMFYNNKAADNLITDNNDSAYWNLKKSLELNPDNIIAINMMGIVHKRLGHLDISEKIYLYGLSLDEDNNTILNNYLTLLKLQNRSHEAKAIELKLTNYVTKNPFYWVDLADVAYANKEYSQAIKLYKKARSMADYLHHPYAGIAKSKKQQGKIKAARVAINKAIENLHTKDSKDKYADTYLKILTSL